MYRPTQCSLTEAHIILPARRYASAIYATVVCLSVRRMLEIYRNGWTDRDGFWYRVYPPLILHCLTGEYY